MRIHLDNSEVNPEPEPFTSPVAYTIDKLWLEKLASTALAIMIMLEGALKLRYLEKYMWHLSLKYVFCQ